MCTLYLLLPFAFQVALVLGGMAAFEEQGMFASVVELVKLLAVAGVGDCVVSGRNRSAYAGLLLLPTTGDTMHCTPFFATVFTAAPDTSNLYSMLSGISSGWMRRPSYGNIYF